MEENAELIEMEKKLQAKLMETLTQKEIVWYQKSRGRWIDQGDRNTKYYHSKTLVRRRRNKVMMLKDNAGRWVLEEVGMRRLALEFYQNLFRDEEVSRTWHANR